MFIPFLAAAAVATTFAQVGALSAWVTVLSLALKTVTMIAIATSLYATELTLFRRLNR